jgi:hypothetical protein
MIGYGYGVGITPNIASLAGFDSDAAAYFTAAGITDTTQKQAVNTLVLSLKANSLWTKFTALYPMVGGSATSHKFNLINPADTNGAFRLSFSGGWVHSSQGAKPNGTTGFADTFINVSTSIANFGTNSHMMFYANSSGSSNGWNIGVGDTGTGNPIYGLAIKRTVGGPFNVDCYDNGNVGSSNGRMTPANAVTESEFFMGVQRASNDRTTYQGRAGVLTETDSALAVVGTPPSASLYLGAINNTGGLQFFMGQSCAGASVGASMNDTEAANYYSAWQAFNTTLGRQI